MQRPRFLTICMLRLAWGKSVASLSCAVLQELTVQSGENASITITALPTAVGACEDTIICQVVSSPVRMDFKVTCMGAKPQVDLHVADCPNPTVLQQQASKTKGGAHARADRSLSPGKGTRARKASGDENASTLEPDAKRVQAPVRRPSSTSLRARPGANQAQMPAATARPMTSSSLGASARRLGAQSRLGGKPTRQPRLASPQVPKPQPELDSAASADSAQAAASSGRR